MKNYPHRISSNNADQREPTGTGLYQAHNRKILPFSSLSFQHLAFSVGAAAIANL